jgi:hypothetical protein
LLRGDGDAFRELFEERIAGAGVETAEEIAGLRVLQERLRSIDVATADGRDGDFFIRKNEAIFRYKPFRLFFLRKSGLALEEGSGSLPAA